MTTPGRIQLSSRNLLLGMIDCDLTLLERAIDKRDPHNELRVRVKDLRDLFEKLVLANMRYGSAFRAHSAD